MSARLAGSRAHRFDVGQNHEMNVTPFVDVMLVLLIIFMVAAPLATTTLPLQLPRSAAATHPNTPLFVALTEDGGLFISGGAVGTKRTSLAALAPDLAPLATTDTEIFIRADKRVSYGRFVAVMDRLREAGYVHVGLVAEQA